MRQQHWKLPAVERPVLEIYDHFGRRLREEQVTLVAGYNSISLNISDLADGMYMIHLSDGIDFEGKMFFKN